MKLGRQAGISLFESIALVVVAGVLIIVLLQQLVHYQAMAKSAVMEMTVENMRSGLRLRVAELMIANRNAEMADLLQQNPVTWLDAPPANYLGQLQQPDRAKLPLDSWYFDLGQHELVYLFPTNNMAWRSPAGAPVSVRSLHIRVTARRQANGATGGSVAEGVSLESSYQQ